eukprot:CAMPEP_0182443662 /NCGR_PEP_ID=MMETSP1172-20130603/2343_1 /TAXON_ID=708627 /ORGANISM="Timspurckia oligopyrenoides, Strain CCMP3278" /LENGTH=311 /DNA_ID=CAMNT_0024639015 /DNA_START=26 /DNA_END=961 /DNA_ORIENTATION=+
MGELGYRVLGREDESIVEIDFLLFPAVSVGNVPQLAIDLIMHTFSNNESDKVSVPIQPVALLHSRSVVPCAGSYDVPAKKQKKKSVQLPSSETLSTALQLFAIERPLSQTKMHLIQQRSPALRGMARQFSGELTAFMIDQHVKQSVMLLSTNAAGRQDLHMLMNSPERSKFDAIRVMMTSSMLNSDLGTKVKSLGVKIMEDGGELGWSPEHSRSVEATDDEIESKTLPRFLPAFRDGSFVRSMLLLCEEKQIPVLVIVSFVHEGENTQDAIRLATAVAEILELSSTPESIQWRTPSSWKHLLGPPPSSGLF